MSRPYQDAKIGLVTQHNKCSVIGPIFESILGASVFSIPANTDQLGTFSGEVSRTVSPLECARRKCDLANNTEFYDYYIASEGSFGPHPDNPFLMCDHEILFFMDKVRDFHHYTSLISTSTNYRQAVIHSFEELLDFSKKALFPSHALIIRPNCWTNKKIIFKGIIARKDLENYFLKAQTSSEDNAVWVETDMRAHMNPTRMEVIGRAAEKLATELNTLCPECECPGWSIGDVKKGLKCSLCSTETPWIKAEIWGCHACDYTLEEPRSDGLTSVSPEHCQLCNP